MHRVEGRRTVLCLLILFRGVPAVAGLARAISGFEFTALVAWFLEPLSSSPLLKRQCMARMSCRIGTQLD